MFNQFLEYVDREFHVQLSEVQKGQFVAYYELLISYNEKVNLTRITNEDEVYFKHFFDSLTMMNVIDLNYIETICDMGAGAGFPSIPLKIIFPHLQITIIDSLGKRIKFLEELLEVLKINGVKLIYNRIETYAIEHQNTFDIVTARALGTLPLILELGLPMVKEHKYFIAYKGANFQEEIDASANAIKVLGAKILRVKEFDLPLEMGFRSQILIEKTANIQGYPRAFAAIKKHPL